jgi:tetratricopeptide (TPR) repeat protein
MFQSAREEPGADFCQRLMRSLYDHLSIDQAVGSLRLRISLIPEMRREFAQPTERLFASALEAFEQGDVKGAEARLGEVLDRDEDRRYQSAELLLRVLRSPGGSRIDENAPHPTAGEVRAEWCGDSPLRLVWGSLLEVRAMQSDGVFGTLANALFNPEALHAFASCVEHSAEPERAAEILYSLHLRTLELTLLYERDADDAASWLRDLGAPLMVSATAMSIYRDYTCYRLGLSDVGSFEPRLAEHLVNRVPRTLAPEWVDVGAMGLFARCGRWDRVLAAAASSTSDAAHLYKAVALVERGMPDAALLVLDEVIRQHQKEEPHSVDDDRYKRAWLLLHLGDAVAARRELAKVYATDPEWIDYAGLVEASQAGTPGRLAERRRAPIPEDVRRAVWRRDGGRCVECGSNERLEFDHIIPHSLGGSDTERNLQLLCEPCNRRKAARI